MLLVFVETVKKEHFIQSYPKHLIMPNQSEFQHRCPNSSKPMLATTTTNKSHASSANVLASLHKHQLSKYGNISCQVAK